MKTEAQLALQYRRLLPALDERGRREWAASEAMVLGRGAIALVHRATGLSRNTIARGIDEITERERGDEPSAGDGTRADVPRRVRRADAGRKPITEREPELLAALEALVEPTSRRAEETPSRRFAGRSRVRGCWPTNWSPRAIG